MQKKILVIFSIVILIAVCYKLFFWSIRDYYYQLKYGAMEVNYELAIKDLYLYYDEIKTLTAADQVKKIDPDYFTVTGYLEWMRLPTVYPYVVNNYPDLEMHDSLIGEGAFLTNTRSLDFTKDKPGEQGAAAYANDAYGDVIEKNIIAFSFNKNYFIGKKRTEMKNEIPTAGSVSSYFMFEFATGKIKYFTTYKALMSEADKLGYKRARFYLEYTKEKESETEYKVTERAKYLGEEEIELLPFQLFYSRFTGYSIDL